MFKNRIKILSLRVLLIYLLVFAVLSNPKPEDSIKKPVNQNNTPDIIWKDLDINENNIIEKDIEYKQINIENRKSERRIYQIGFTRDGKNLLVVTSFRISLLSLPELTEIAYLEPRNIVPGGFTGVSLSHDSRELLVGSSWENTALLLDWSGSKLKKYSCKEPYTYPEDVKFSLDNKIVYVSCLQYAKDRKYMAIYKISGEEISFSEVKHSYIEILKNQVYTFSSKEILMKDIQSGKNFIIRFPNIVQSYTFFNEKEWVTGSEGQWTFWSLVGSNLIKKSSFTAMETGFKGEDYKLDTDYRNYAALSPTGSYLLTGGVKAGYLWSRSGELKKKLVGHSRNVSAVAFSPDGSFVVTASPEKIILWGKDISENPVSQ